jgi:ROK family
MIKQQLYKHSILRELYFSRMASCADLSAKTQKSLPLIQRVINEMMDDGIVEESGLAPSTGGRRPLLYSLKPQRMYTVSAAMDQFITKIVVRDTCNNSVGVRELELPLGREGVVDRLRENIQATISGTGIERNKFMGLGIGMPGFVEFRFGSARGQKNAMVVNIGWGVGLGMILNGQLFRGHNGFAGEFSHIPLFNNNKLCQCGKSGCLETESSLQVVVEKITEGLNKGRLSSLKKSFNTGHLQKDWEEIVSATVNGDQFVIEVLSQIGYNLGRGIAVLIHLINPEAVILSGRGAKAGKLWLAPIQQALNEHCIPRMSANTSIGISSLGDEAISIGCSALVAEHFNTDSASSILTSQGKKIIRKKSVRPAK